MSLMIAYAWSFSPHGGLDGAFRRRSLPRGGEVAMIDVSNLPVDSSGSLQDLLALSSSSSTSGDFSAIQVAQNLAPLLFGGAFLLLDERPKGSCREDLVDIRRSQIPTANLGVYASKTIPAGTVLGTFPGRVKSLEDCLSSKSSDEAADRSKRYLWAVDASTVLDPTNDNGDLDLELKYFFGLKSVNTIIARINEPPKGGDCNVYTRVGSGGTSVEVIAERDIFPNTELYMDYGSAFDRSSYAEKKRRSEDQARFTAERLREEEDMVRVQPVVASRDYDGLVDQDTSLEDGFLSKLRKREQESGSRYRDAGILSPEDGLDAFKDMGAGMFGEKDDQELLRSMRDGERDSERVKLLSEDDGDAMLRGQVSTKGAMGEGPNSIEDFLGMGGGGEGDILSPDDAMNMFGTAKERAASGTDAELDDDIINTLRSQLGNMAAEPGQEDVGMSMDGDMMAGLLKTAEEKMPPTDIPPRPETVTALTPEEAESLQRKIDDMTDEQVEKVFSKMRAAIGDRVEKELGSKLAEKMKETATSRRMAMEETVSPEIRKKYEKELTMIEDELEKMCEDPLGVWQNLATNADKFIEDQDEKSNDKK